jgi:DNA-binding NarL/FixJ family response regulator
MESPRRFGGGAARPGAEPPIRIVIVDDHTVVRLGLRAFFDATPDTVVVDEASDGREALAVLARLQVEDRLPDVVMMDLLMPNLDGIEATRIIRDRHPTVRVVAMTSFSETERVNSALSAGAAGYLLKDADATEVGHAVRAAYAGEVHLDPVVARSLTRTLTNAGADNTRLTSRERDILVLVAQGLNNQDIADRLIISERTARSHVSSILTKLGLASRTQAALWALREGLVTLP